jgi:hypothetical protein
VQVAASARQEQARRADVEEIRAALGEIGQQLDDVEVVEKAIDDGDDGTEDAGFPGGVH